MKKYSVLVSFDIFGGGFKRKTYLIEERDEKAAREKAKTYMINDIQKDGYLKIERVEVL